MLKKGDFRTVEMVEVFVDAVWPFTIRVKCYDSDGAEIAVITVGPAHVVYSIHEFNEASFKSYTPELISWLNFVYSIKKMLPQKVIDDKLNALRMLLFKSTTNKEKPLSEQIKDALMKWFRIILLDNEIRRSNLGELLRLEARYVFLDNGIRVRTTYMQDEKTNNEAEKEAEEKGVSSAKVFKDRIMVEEEIVIGSNPDLDLETVEYKELAEITIEYTAVLKKYKLEGFLIKPLKVNNIYVHMIR
jgi:hypothetical protein